MQVTKFTSAPAELDRALGRLSSVTPTAALLDALSDASTATAAAPTERRMVLVVVASYRMDQSSLRPISSAATSCRCRRDSSWAVEVRAETGNFSNQAREEAARTGQPPERRPA